MIHCQRQCQCQFTMFSVDTAPERSAAFNQAVFDRESLQRRTFKIEGVWLSCGPSLLLDLTNKPSGTFRTKGVDNNDVHFTFPLTTSRRS